MKKKYRIVIIGAGFAGFNLAKSLRKSNLEVYLIDRNNFHQFQPLYYQVATAALEPASISFPLRKAFQKAKNIHIRMAEVIEINTVVNYLVTSEEVLHYDSLVIATGADTNFFGNEQMKQHAIPMKSVSEAIHMRNHFLQNLESAYYADAEEKECLRNVVVVGGGPTGVEISGAIADMKRYVLAKDYPELNIPSLKIFLVENSPELLGPMSTKAQEKAKQFLEEMGVTVVTGTRLQSYDGQKAVLSNGVEIPTKTVIWAAGIIAEKFKGLPDNILQRGNRIKVNRHNQVQGFQNIFALGDIAYMETGKYPNGHPQVARVAISQAQTLAKNLVRKMNGVELLDYEYKDMGSMATIGRRKAVVDLPGWKFQGAFAWHVWNVIHLFSLIGVRNKLSVFFSWSANYFSPDPNLRVLIKPFHKTQTLSQPDDEI